MAGYVIMKPVMTMNLSFKINQKDDCYMIRKQVFMDEQGFENEYDEIDDWCTFLTLYDDDICIGCARFFESGQKDIWIFGRLALIKTYRGKHLGKEIVLYAERYLKQREAKEIHLHAQCSKIAFYESMGYACYGDIDLDEGVKHIWMKKKLDKKG